MRPRKSASVMAAPAPSSKRSGGSGRGVCRAMKGGGTPDAVDGDAAATSINLGGGDAGHAVNAAKVIAAAATLEPATTMARMNESTHADRSRAGACFGSRIRETRLAGIMPIVYYWEVVRSAINRSMQTILTPSAVEEFCS